MPDRRTWRTIRSANAIDRAIIPHPEIPGTGVGVGVEVGIVVGVGVGVSVGIGVGVAVGLGVGVAGDNWIGPVR